MAPLGPQKRTLGVTSPPTKGEDVKRAQFLLNGNNAFKEDYSAGRLDLDGEFGPLTGNACKSAKYWLGYAAEDIKPVFGADLYGYLTQGLEALPPEYKRRRTARKKAAASTPLGEKMLKIAMGEVGYVEQSDSRSSNITKYGKWYGLDRQPWCFMFVTWAAVKAGSKLLKAGSYYAFTPYGVQDALRGVRLRKVTADALKPGDLVFFDFQEKGMAPANSPYNTDHVGFFHSWVNKAAGTFATVEGNTSEDDRGSQNNGGMVAYRDKAPRRMSQVSCFARVMG